MTALSLGPDLGPDPLDTLRHVLSLHPDGQAVEFGVASGRTLSLIADTMPVVGFDSFNGLPEYWRPGFGRGRFACAPPPGFRLVVGLFVDTLPHWWAENGSTVGLVHIDCDLYSSTATILDVILPLPSGTYVVFDEWHGYPGCEGHEQRAWSERTDPVDWDIIGHGPEQWAVRKR